MIQTGMWMVLTVGVYALSRSLNRRWPSPWTLPVLTSTALLMLLVVASGAGLEGYAGAQRHITGWLGPATVSLAVPLYRYRALLLRHGWRVSAAIVFGTLVAMLSAIVLARLLGLSSALQAALSLKTATAPIAIALAPQLRATPAIVAGIVVAAALLGSMVGPVLMNRMEIRNPLARGLALGTICSGQGVAGAFAEAELSGAAASVAMGLAAVVVSLLAPPLGSWLAP
jgi:putative effector of murein hydrolase